MARADVKRAMRGLWRISTGAQPPHRAAAECVHRPEGRPGPLGPSLPLPASLGPRRTTHPLSVSLSLLTPDVSCKRNHTVFGLLCSDSFTCSVFKIHPRGSTRRNSISSCAQQHPLHRHHELPAPPRQWVGRGCRHRVATEKSAAVTTCTQIFVQTPVCNPLGVHSGVE